MGANPKSLIVHDITTEQEQCQGLLESPCAVRDGDFSAQLPVHWDGTHGKIAACFNETVVNNRHPADELARVGEKIGRQGQTSKRIAAPNRVGAWLDIQQSVNGLIDDLVRPVETMTEAIAGVDKGDLTRAVPLESDGRMLQGEFLRSATIVKRMIEQMSEFSSEVTRVALEVGTSGRRGDQTKGKGVSGVWKDLTDHVNSMAWNLTTQVRNIAEVATAVAKGDRHRRRHWLGPAGGQADDPGGGFRRAPVKQPAFDAIQRLCNPPFSRHVDDEQTQT